MKKWSNWDSIKKQDDGYFTNSDYDIFDAVPNNVLKGEDGYLYSSTPSSLSLEQEVWKPTKVCRQEPVNRNNNLIFMWERILHSIQITFLFLIIVYHYKKEKFPILDNFTAAKVIKISKNKRLFLQNPFFIDKKQ